MGRDDVLNTRWTKDRRDAERIVDQARYRARRAGDALAGRREPPRWPLLVGLTAAGVVAGWLAAMSTRRALAVIANESVQGEQPYGEDEVLPNV